MTAKFYTDNWPQVSAVVCEIFSPRVSDVNFFNFCYNCISDVACGTCISVISDVVCGITVISDVVCSITVISDVVIMWLVDFKTNKHYIVGIRKMRDEGGGAWSHPFLVCHTIS